MELVKGADFICIRELTGGMYFGEKYQDNDKAYDTNYYTRPEIERILKVAFQYAMQRRKHLTVVDKANVLDSSRLWRATMHRLAEEYSDVEYRKYITDENLIYENGRIKIGDKPGLGIEINEEACLAHPYQVHTLRHYTGALTAIRPAKTEFYF